MRRPALLLLFAALLAPTSAAASGYTIKGHGDGHGIGMSQWGAYGYAKHGWAYGRILGHYYRGTTLSHVSGGSVRVLLQSGRGGVAFAGATSAGGKKLNAKRTYTARLRGGKVEVTQGSQKVGSFSAPLAVRSKRGAVRLGGTALNGVANGAYRGSLELRAASAGGLTAVNVVGLDDYVKGVVPGEAISSWPAAALEAQAVAARSYALATDAGGAVFDQFPDTRSQVYRGMDGETSRTNSAVSATAREVLRYRGKIATTYFFSASGGRTENVENVFYGSPPEPYLRSVKDPYEAGAPRHTWRIKLTRAKVAALLGSLVKGSFRGIRVTKRGKSPRIVWAEVVGSNGTTRVRGTTLKARLGLYDTWATFPSLAKASAAPRAGAKAGAAPAPAAAPSRAAPAAPRAADSDAPAWRWPVHTWSLRATP